MSKKTTYKCRWCPTRVTLDEAYVVRAVCDGITVECESCVLHGDEEWTDKDWHVYHLNEGNYGDSPPDKQFDKRGEEVPDEPAQV